MEEKKQNKENTQTIWNEIFRLHIQTLLYTSFSQKTQSKGSYFYLCSKNTRALVQSLNWLRSDLVSDFEEEGKAERWCCDRLWLHIVSGWLSFTFLSCLSWCQTFYDFTGWDPKHLIQEARVCVCVRARMCVRVLMYVFSHLENLRQCDCLSFPSSDLSSGSDGWFICQDG